MSSLSDKVRKFEPTPDVKLGDEPVKPNAVGGETKGAARLIDTKGGRQVRVSLTVRPTLDLFDRLENLCRLKRVSKQEVFDRALEAILIDNDL